MHLRLLPSPAPFCDFPSSRSRNFLATCSTERHVLSTCTRHRSTTIPPVLSIVNCKLFKQALADNGILQYTVGNFALHYWPSLRLLFRLWQLHPKLLYRKLDWHIFTSISYIPVQLLLLYCMLNNPSSQYKCPAQLRESYFVIAIVVAAVGIEIAVTLFVGNAMSSKPSRQSRSSVPNRQKYKPWY